jgi:hypothetical protein
MDWTSNNGKPCRRGSNVPAVRYSVSWRMTSIAAPTCACPCRMWWKPRPPTTPASALHAAVHEAATLTSQQLDIVRHALNKFGGQHYGLCERCGEVIGYSRLNARPEARLCIACQTRLEQPRR